MIPIIICVGLSGVLTLFLIAPIMHSRPRTCYTLMLLIPSASMAIAAMVLPIGDVPIPPNKADTVSQRAEMHIKQGNFDEAIRLLTQNPQATEKNGKNRDILLQLGRTYFAKGLLHAEHNEKDEALANLKQAYDISPDDAEFLSDLRHFIDRVEKMEKNSETK